MLNHNYLNLSGTVNHLLFLLRVLCHYFLTCISLEAFLRPFKRCYLKFCSQINLNTAVSSNEIGFNISKTRLLSIFIMQMGIVNPCKEEYFIWFHMHIGSGTLRTEHRRYLVLQETHSANHSSMCTDYFISVTLETLQAEHNLICWHCGLFVSKIKRKQEIKF